MSLESKLHRLCNEAVHSALDKEEWSRRRDRLKNVVGGIKDQQVCGRLCGCNPSAAARNAVITAGLFALAAAVAYFAWKKFKGVMADEDEGMPSEAPPSE